MRKLLIVLLCLAIAGCYEVISREELDRAYSECEPNGGLRRIALSRENAKAYFHCENGARFKYYRKSGVTNT